MPKYIAKQSIGHFMPGDEIKGLEEKHLQALLASGAIEEEKAPEQLKADAEVAELQKKVEGLEKSLASSEAALKKATTEAKKATADK